MLLRIFGYIILVFHTILFFVLYLLPYFTNNIYILLFFLLLYIFILTQWHFLGSCFLNIIENKLILNKSIVSKTGKEKSLMESYIFKFIGYNNAYIIGLLPLISGTYSYIKILLILQNKNKKTIKNKKQ
jgi:hypothetical protein